MADHYGYSSNIPPWDDEFIFKHVKQNLSLHRAKTVFELGCGNGQTAKRLIESGFSVTAIEASESGAKIAQSLCPGARIDVCSVYEDLAARYGQFDAVVSLEVLEHLYDPKLFAKRCFEVLCPGGIAVISTPYHGYLKNLAIALVGKYDSHHNPLWDHGHIKFFSRATLTQLFVEQGFTPIDFKRLGRLPVIAKSMLGVFQKPQHS